jgi:5-methylcytosine-specific restriction protein A
MIGRIVHAARVVQNAVREKLKARSGKWPEVQKAHLAVQPKCAACGGDNGINVHHIQPFHIHPELELDPTNLITLCMGYPWECHLMVGHGGSFKARNPDVVKDAAAFGQGDIEARRKLVEHAKLSRLF